MKIVFCKEYNLFIYIFVSFLVSIVFHIVLGAQLSIEYIVSIALVVIGASWSFLSLEVNQVDKLRDEYVKQLNNCEESVNIFLKDSFELFIEIANFNYLSNQDFLKYHDELNIKNTAIKSSYDIMRYKIRKLEVYSHEELKLERIIKVSDDLYKSLSDHAYKVVKDNEGASDDEIELFNKRSDILRFLMVEDFSRNIISFEEFSKEYRDKKMLCISAVCFCVFIVLIKGFSSLL